MKKLICSKRFLIPMIVGLVLCGGVIALDISRDRGVLYGFCDGFFVAGALLLCAGGLTYLSGQGLFDIFGFGVSHVLTIRWPGLSPMTDEHRKETYVEYKERKSKGRKTSPMGLVLSGGVYLLVAIVLTLISELT